MAAADDIRRIFAGYRFGAPCTVADIDSAERKLGERLPGALRELYAAFDGFVGPTNADFFWPLFGRNELVEMNRFLRGEPFPTEWTSQCLFFGDYGCGPHWAFNRDLPDRVIVWDPEWGTDFDVVGGSPLEVWCAEKQQYDSLDGSITSPPLRQP